MIYTRRAGISTAVVVVAIVVLILAVGVGYYVLMPNSSGTPTTSHSSSSHSSSSSSSSSSTSSSPSTSSSVPAVVCSSTPVSGAVQVTIADFFFSPKNVTILAGQSVQWTYPNGNFRHTVTSDTGLFGSASLFVGGTYTCTFNSPGTYGYHCSNHPATMKDNFVIVT